MTDKEIIVKGYFPQLSTEEDYKFTGRLLIIRHTVLNFMWIRLRKECLQQKQESFIIYQVICFLESGGKQQKQLSKSLGKMLLKKYWMIQLSLDMIPSLSDEKKETLLVSP